MTSQLIQTLSKNQKNYKYKLQKHRPNNLIILPKT